MVSKLLEAKEAEIEVASLKLGDQVEAEWLPLIGISRLIEILGETA